MNSYMDDTQTSASSDSLISHSEESDVSIPTQPQKNKKRRHATVYDAVAGRVSDRHGERGLKARVIRHSTKETPLAPDEVLFRRKDAPTRYQEHDIYHAHEWKLPHGGRGVLPESDLLKAIHGYASKFYSAKESHQHIATAARPIRNIAERSMDETALLAFGILLQEAGREVLGRRGDLVFTEGVAISDTRNFTVPAADGVAAPREDLRVVGHQDIGPWRRGPKRRKVVDQEPTQ